MDDVIEKNEELDSNLKEDLEDFDLGIEDESDSEDAEDIEFETDESGDIVIKESEEDESDNNNASADKQDEPEAEEEKADDTPAAKEVVEPAKEPDEKDLEIERLRRANSEWERQTNDTLEKMGITDAKGIDGLVRLAAEAEDITPEEYKKRRDQEAKNEEARRFLQKAQFEKKIVADLAEVHASYPETKKYASVRDFPNYRRFGELRDAGLSAKEAYIAAHSDDVRASVASSVKQQSLNGTKNHIQSVVPKQTKDTSIRIPKKEFDEYRELFPHLSDKEIVALYKRTK